MELTPSDFKSSYASMSDSELMEIRREDLVNIARPFYDEEMQRRNLVAAGSPTDGPSTSDLAGGSASQQTATVSIAPFVKIGIVLIVVIALVGALKQAGPNAGDSLNKLSDFIGVVGGACLAIWVARRIFRSRGSKPLGGSTTTLFQSSEPQYQCPKCKHPVQLDTQRCPGCGGLFKAGLEAGLTDENSRDTA
jgi:hypothetical protein